MKPFPFAKRTNWPRQGNAINAAQEKWAAAKIPVLDLTASNPTTCGFKYPPGLLKALSSPKNLHYDPQSSGLFQARQAVADYYRRKGVQTVPSDILLTASTSEAYTFLIRLLVNPGEKVLIPKPSYPLFQFLLEINDVPYEYYELHFDGSRWALDTAGLARLIDAKTKAVILVNPNNPTGSFINAAELNALNEICAKRGVSIISDEVFFDYAHSGQGHVSCAGNHKVLTFVLGGLSKALALPQMKCSWVLASGPKALVQESLSRLEIIADTYLSVNTPVQQALASWFKSAPGLQKQIIQRVEKNGAWLKAHLNAHTQLLPFEGGWYATLRIPAVKTEEQWVLEFLNEDKVLVYPGYFFDMPQEAYIVVSLLPLPKLFQEAATRILARLSRI